MESIPEGEGSVLDNCMIMFDSGMADGHKPIHHELPCILAGKAGVQVETERH